MKKLDSRWTRHLKGDEKEEFQALVRNSTQVLTRLYNIILDEEERIYEAESKETDYSASDWANLQAHRNGRKQELRTLRKLVEHLEG